MGSSNVTGNGNGIAIPNIVNRNIAPKIVASGIISNDGDVFTVLFPKTLKRGIDHYIVTGMVENYLPDDGGSPTVSQAKTMRVTKLDDRWSLSGNSWVYDNDVAAGNMKGFIIRIDDIIGGGEGSRDAQVMWTVCTTGYDPVEFA
jgi:hypothetical protein